MILPKISILVLVFTIVIIPCMYNGAIAQDTFRDRNFFQTDTNPSLLILLLSLLVEERYSEFYLIKLRTRF